MRSKIHPTAVVHESSSIGEDAEVGPYAVIGPNVKVGARTRIQPHCHIVCRTTIGDDCHISSSAVIGGDPQDIKFKGEDTDLVIGDRNRIGEFTTINRGTGGGGGVTRIGNDNMIMAYSHIAHDCVIGNSVVITNSTQLAGHIKIEDMAWISGLCAIHHFVTVGAMSFLVPRSGVRFDVPPYMVVDGFKENSRVRGLNFEGLHRRQVPAESLSALKAAYHILYREDSTQAAALEVLLKDPVSEDPYVKNLIEHIQASLAGYQNRALERLRTDKTRHFSRKEETAGEN